MDSRGTDGRIYKEDNYTLLNTKYESSGPCGFGADFIIFLCFTHDPPPHTHTQNMKALGLVVSEKKIFLYFPHDAPGAGPVRTPGARMAGFMKRTTRHCYTQNMKALGLVVSEKKIFLCFSHYKSMGAICCHGNQSSNPTRPKTFHNLSPSSMMLKIKFDHHWPYCLRDI